MGGDLQQKRTRRDTRVKDATLTDILLLSSLLKQDHSPTLSASPRSSSSPMTEVLGVDGCVVLDDHVHVGQIEPSGGDVRAEKEGGGNGSGGVGGEGLEDRGSVCRGKVTVEGRDGVVGQEGKFGKDLDRKKKGD